MIIVYKVTNSVLKSLQDFKVTDVFVDQCINQITCICCRIFCLNHLVGIYLIRSSALLISLCHIERNCNRTSQSNCSIVATYTIPHRCRRSYSCCLVHPVQFIRTVYEQQINNSLYIREDCLSDLRCQFIVRIYDNFNPEFCCCIGPINCNFNCSRWILSFCNFTDRTVKIVIDMAVKAAQPFNAIVSKQRHVLIDLIIEKALDIAIEQLFIVHKNIGIDRDLCHFRKFLTIFQNIVRKIIISQKITVIDRIIDHFFCL